MKTILSFVLVVSMSAVCAAHGGGGGSGGHGGGGGHGSHGAYAGHAATHNSSGHQGRAVSTSSHGRIGYPAEVGPAGTITTTGTDAWGYPTNPLKYVGSGGWSTNPN